VSMVTATPIVSARRAPTNRRGKTSTTPA
jgi:hypothetical protein